MNGLKCVNMPILLVFFISLARSIAVKCRFLNYISDTSTRTPNTETWLMEKGFKTSPQTQWMYNWNLWKTSNFPKMLKSPYNKHVNLHCCYKIVLKFMKSNMFAQILYLIQYWSWLSILGEIIMNNTFWRNLIDDWLLITR